MSEMKLESYENTRYVKLVKHCCPYSSHFQRIKCSLPIMSLEASLP